MFGMRVFFGTRIDAAGSPRARSSASPASRSCSGPSSRSCRADGDTAIGAFFTVLAVVLSTSGRSSRSATTSDQMPLWQSMAWGMLYGSIFSLAVALASGKPLGFELTAGYVASLLYLAILGSIIAFGAYLTFLKRVGHGRLRLHRRDGAHRRACSCRRRSRASAGSVLTWLGIAISVAGNVIILRRR